MVRLEPNHSNSKLPGCVSQGARPTVSLCQKMRQRFVTAVRDSLWARLVLSIPGNLVTESGLEWPLLQLLGLWGDGREPVLCGVR